MVACRLGAWTCSRPRRSRRSSIGTACGRVGALGQNFLADPNTARRIVRLAGIEAGARVVEVGPGLGSLTLALADAGASEIVALELDRHLVPVLREVLEGRAEVRIEEGDALDDRLARAVGRAGARWSMVSNLPYNVATPLVVRVLETAPMVDRLLVMVQREVGERLAAGPGTDAYGAVSVKVAYYAHAELAGIVPPTVFMPKPAVDSALVRLVRRERPPVEVPDVERLFVLVRRVRDAAQDAAARSRPSSDRAPSRSWRPPASIRASAPRRSGSTNGPRSRGPQAPGIA